MTKENTYRCFGCQSYQVLDSMDPTVAERLREWFSNRRNPKNYDLGEKELEKEDRK